MLANVTLAALIALAPLAAAAQTVPDSSAEIAQSFSPVVKTAAPAVVNIYATRVVEQNASPFAGDPFFDQFFRAFGNGQPRVQNSLGSGVVLTADGIVVSNYHVVGRATEIRVVLNDRREYAATVVLGDEAADLAVLKLQGATDLPFVPLRNSDEIEVGDLVLAIGNPFGVGQTVSQGIVSGLARSTMQLGNGSGYFIQTDAAINPGNSGGALVDTKGRLVGINTAILSRSGGSQGIGFAIPANLVASIVKQAVSGATRFQRPWAGLSGQAMDASLAESMGLPRPDGVLVSDLHPESPFAAAGIRKGDVILSLGGAPTNTPQEIMFRLASLGLGAETRIDWLRDGVPMSATVTLAVAPDTPDRQAMTVTADVALNGLSVARINPAVTAEFDLPLNATGVVVTDAQAIAARAGFARGDIVVAINGVAIDTPADVVAAANDPSSVWTIDLIRAGQTLRLRFRF